MIKGVGIDIVEISRIENLILKYSKRFLNRVFGAEELIKKNVFHLAGKFAAKESFIKAIGKLEPISYKEILILNEANGKPYIKLTKKVKHIIKKLNAKEIFLSISHAKNYATAMVVIQ